MQRPYFQIRSLHRCRGLGFRRIFCGGTQFSSEQCPDSPLFLIPRPPTLSGSPRPSLFCSLSPAGAASPAPWAHTGSACGCPWSRALPVSLLPPQALPTSLKTLLRLAFPEAKAKRDSGNLFGPHWLLARGTGAPSLKLVFCLLHRGDTWPLPTLVWVVSFLETLDQEGG